MSKSYIRVEYLDLNGVKKRPKMRPAAAQRLVAAGWASFKSETTTEAKMRDDYALERHADGSYFPVPRELPPATPRPMESVLRMRLDCERWPRWACWALDAPPDPRELHDPLMHAPFCTA